MKQHIATRLGLRQRGKKLTCACGECRKCRHRDAHQKYARLKAGKPVSEPSDQELDEIMTRYFAEKGWD